MKTLPESFARHIALPAIAAPMFLVSGPDLVTAVSASGLVGTFPALNQRTNAGFAEWCDTIIERLAATPNAAPWGVNLIVHKTNPRLAQDLETCVAKKAPLVITSLGAVADVVDAVHSYGGLVFHDVIGRRHAEKAAAAGVDGIIAVACGAGGHAGTLNPFALLSEIRQVFDGPLILAGAMNTGRDIAAARAMGADFAYLGTRFIATSESMAGDAQKAMQLRARAADIVYTPSISGVAANFLRESLVEAGLDPDNLPAAHAMALNEEARAWKTIWSAGHGVGGIADVPPARELCARLIAEYDAAIATLAMDPYAMRRARVSEPT